MPFVRLLPPGALEARAKAALLAATTESAALLEQRAQPEIPVDEGDLRDSLRVDAPRLVGSFAWAKVIAGEGLDYAIIVHQKHPNNGTKFLERPLISHVPLHAAILAKHSRSAF